MKSFFVLLFFTSLLVFSAEETPEQLLKNGNFREAWNLALPRLHSAKENLNSKESAELWFSALKCLSRMNEPEKYEDLLCLAETKYAKNLYLLAGLKPGMIPNSGFMQNGKFIRGRLRGNDGPRYFSGERDRARILKLFANAIPEAEKAEKSLQKKFWTGFYTFLLSGREGCCSWKLLRKTGLVNLPPLDSTWEYDCRTGAPVREDGTPVFHSVPKDFGSAKNDGERLRYCAEKGNLIAERARFLRSQFDGVNRYEYESGDPDFRKTLHFMPDDRTYAALSDGKRFITLPDEFNYLKLYEKAGDHAAAGRIREHRYQYEHALREYRKIKNPPTWVRQRIDDIAGNHIQLQPVSITPEGTKPKVQIRFRNTRLIRWTLWKIDRIRLMDELLAWMKKGGGYSNITFPFSSDKLPLSAKPVMEGKYHMFPPSHHFEGETSMELPLLPDGGYLLKAAAENGDTRELPLWVTKECLILRKDAPGKEMFAAVLNAADGKPVPDRELVMHIFRTYYAKNSDEMKAFGGRTKTECETKTFKTNSDGYAFLPKIGSGQVLIVSGNTVLHGEDYAHVPERIPDRLRAFLITDRPLYKPGDKVSFSGILRKSSYVSTDFDCPEELSTTIYPPRGDKPVFKAMLKTDKASSSVSGSFVLPKDAQTGEYTLTVTAKNVRNTIRFRVEEYRKPEYELEIVSPEKPVRTGDTFRFIIRGKYLFGSPLAGGKVKYQIFRTKHHIFHPFINPLLWLYPMDTNRFSCPPEELVQSGKGILNSKGELILEVNTSVGRRHSGDDDMLYRIEAEVSDSSGKVEKNSASVTVSKHSFRVFLFMERGFACTGDTLRPKIRALTPDGKEISGNCILTVISGKEKREFRFSAEESPAFVLTKPGICRLVCEVTSKEGITEKTEEKFYVAGPDLQTEGLFSTVPLEIKTDKNSYKPGETAKILLLSDKPDTLFYVFKRSARENSPVLVSAGKNCSAGILWKVDKSDMPNAWIQVFMVRNGKLEHLSKRIDVPPEDKILSVSVTVPEGKAAPATIVPVTVRVTDSQGKPVSGNAAVTVYDKALDLMNGGSNVPDIRSFFWSWNRSSAGWFVSSLRHPVSPLYVKNKLCAGVANSAMDSLSLEGTSAEKTFLRKDFRDSILWTGVTSLSEKGELPLALPLPDDLTTWKIRVWILDKNCKAGSGENELLVSKELIVRLELPRTMTEGDISIASANFHNNTGKTLTVISSLRTEGGCLQAGDNPGNKITIPPHGHKTVRYILKAVSAGTETITLSADGGKQFRDGVVRKLHIGERAAEKHESFQRILFGKNPKNIITLNIPQERKKDRTSFHLEITPGTASAVMRLLPYLAADRSGNIYSSVSRFLPALCAMNAAADTGIDLSKLKIVPGKEAELWHRYGEVPAFTAQEMKKNCEESLTMILKSRNSDGGWGWFSGGREISYADTTSAAAEALYEASLYGKNVPHTVLDQAIQWLWKHAEKRVDEIRKNNSIQESDAMTVKALSRLGKNHNALEKLLFQYRMKLSPAGLAFLGQTLPKGPEKQLILRNLRQYLAADPENGSAFLNIPPSLSCCWGGDENCANAAFLELLIENDPADPLIPMLAAYLTGNISNSPWRNSTRSLGAAIRGLVRCLRTSGEMTPDFTVKVYLDGKQIQTFHCQGESLWSAPKSLDLDAGQLTTGKHEIALEFSGRGKAWCSGTLSCSLQEKEFTPYGLEMKLSRNLYLLKEKNTKLDLPRTRGNPVPGMKRSTSRIRIDRTVRLNAGDVVEAEINVQAKNDYDYVLVRFPLPAGFAFEETKSGWMDTNRTPVYCEYRETEARFYCRNIARGNNLIRVRMRAQLPGSVILLPVQGKGVYAPMLRGGTGSSGVEVFIPTP